MFNVVTLELKKRCLLIVLISGLVAMFCFPVSAQPEVKDTLYFYNKTKLVGKLLKIRLGRVEFDATGIGIIKIKNNKISSIHAQSRNFRVETTDRRVLQGYLLRSPTPGHTVAYNIIESEEIEVEDISTLVYYGKTWKSRVSGNVGLGYSFTKSSGIGRLNANGLFKYNTENTQTQLQGDLIWTADSLTSERERENLRLGFDYAFSSVWVVGGFVYYQRNIELGLQRRLQEGVGAGVKVPFNSNQLASVLTGVGVNQELSLEGSEQSNTEVILQINYDLFSFERPNISISLVESMYFSLVQKGRIRSDGDLSLNWELISDFYLDFQFYYNFDNESPATGMPNTDYGIVAGITYKF
jgi:hypothetical protein